MAIRLDPLALRRFVGGGSLLLMPALGIASSLVLPAFTGSIGNELTSMAAQSGRWLAGMALDLGASLLIIPVALTILHVVGRRAPLLGHLGATLLVVGAFMHSAMLGFQLAEVPLAARAGTTEMTALTSTVEAMYSHQAFEILVLPFTTAFYLGFIILAVALWTSHVTWRVVPVLILAALAAEVLAPPGLNARVFFGLLFLALGALGVQVLRMTPVEWEREGHATAARPAAVSSVADAPST